MSVEAISWVMRTPFGSPAKKLVMVVLANWADEDDSSCFPGQKAIAQRTEQNERTVRRLLVELEEDGWIKREHRQRSDGSRTSDRYYLQIQPDNLAGRPDDQLANRALGASNRTSDAGQPGTVPGHYTSVDTPVETPDTSRTPPSEPQRIAGLVEALEQSVAVAKEEALKVAERRFEKFWERYPKRNGKRVGKAKARLLWMRMSPSEHEAAWVGVRHYAASDWIPKDPERWLRDRCWEDWQEPAQPSTNGRRQAPTVVEPDRPAAFPFNASSA
jgi:hypothetical protein